MKIYITRHGQTNWNVLKKVMGRCDEPLNDKGKEQANTTKNKLDDKKIDLIICSPLLRAKETAEIINKSKKLPIIYEKNLIQRDFGELEGLQTKEFDFDGFWNYYKNQKYIKAENIQDFFARVYKFLDYIIKKYKDKNVLLVAHGGISIPIACYFNKNIPEGSLIEAGLVLDNCEVREYNI